MEFILIALLLCWLFSREGCGCVTAIAGLTFLGFIFLLLSFTV